MVKNLWRRSGVEEKPVIVAFGYGDNRRDWYLLANPWAKQQSLQFELFGEADTSWEVWTLVCESDLNECKLLI